MLWWLHTNPSKFPEIWLGSKRYEKMKKNKLWRGVFSFLTCFQFKPTRCFFKVIQVFKMFSCSFVIHRATIGPSIAGFTDEHLGFQWSTSVSYILTSISSSSLLYSKPKGECVWFAAQWSRIYRYRCVYTCVVLLLKLRLCPCWRPQLKAIYPNSMLPSYSGTSI